MSQERQEQSSTVVGLPDLLTAGLVTGEQWKVHSQRWSASAPRGILTCFRALSLSLVCVPVSNVLVFADLARYWVVGLCVVGH